MHSTKLFRTYPRNHEHKRNFRKEFPWLISKNVYLSLCKFSNRTLISGLNNGRLKTGVVNLSTPLIEADYDLSGGNS